ncbi:MAG: OsmC family protein [Bacteroidetes bacterium]|nr:OsmC family protein [Bacteroidota bacterium]
MDIKIKRLDDAYHLEASNDTGNTVQTDGSEKIGGGGKGMRPMQMLLASLGSCSAIDVITFLKKQRQELKDIEIDIHGDREADQVPSLFTDIHMKYVLYGDLEPKKVERALSLSVEKYCSVAKMIEKNANITYSYEIRS